MSQDFVQLLSQSGSAVVVCVLFLLFLREERADRSRERDQYLAVLDKHSFAIDQLTARIAARPCIRHGDDLEDSGRKHA